MKILITGATGFIGKSLVPYLFTNGMNDIALLVRNTSKAKEMFHGFSPVLISMEEKWNDEVISYNPDIVLHMATKFTGRNDAENIKEIIDTNILLTTMLVEALSHTDCTYFLNAGTFTEYVHGVDTYFANNLYSASKTAVRPIIRFYQTQSKWHWINVIIYSPYGRRNESKKVIDYMIDSMDAKVPINFTEGIQTLDFIHVDDIANFFYCLFQNISVITDDFTEIHLGTGHGYTLRAIAGKIEEIWDKKINAKWGGVAYTPLDVMSAVAPMSKKLSEIGWCPKIALNEGLVILKKDLYG